MEVLPMIRKALLVALLGPPWQADELKHDEPPAAPARSNFWPAAPACMRGPRLYDRERDGGSC
jgi:hypothetical protein